MDPRRRAGAAAVFALVVLGLPTGMLGVAWPSIREALGAPLAGLGVILGAMTVTQFAASSFSGAIRARLGTTRVLLVPALFAAAGLAVFAFAGDWLVITLAAAILGAGLGVFDAAVNTEAALTRGVRFMGALHASWAAGAAIGPAVITFAILSFGTWRIGFGLAAVLFVAVALAVIAMRGTISEAPQHDLPSADSGARHVVIGAALMFVYVGIELSAGQWSFTRFTFAAELDTETAAAAIFLYWAGLGVGRLVLAVIGDRVGAPRWLDLSVVGALLTTLAFSLLPPNVAGLVVLPALGLCLSVFVPVLIYVTPQRTGHAAAPHAIGYMVAAGMLGGAVLPAAIGVLMQSVGVPSLGPALAILAAALGALHVVASRLS
ncbi:MAG: MFS transporter [Chloroflexota bacterium]|nr:MFS transporter [Chloroflexota bacterium]